MPRFFAEIQDQDHAVITGNDARHIQGPLRKKIGDELFIRDHTTGYRARISSIGPQQISLDILSSQELSERGTIMVHLGMSLIDLKEMDVLIRIVTELGVADIYPLVAERSNIRTVSDTRYDRWNTIIKEAVKQCERRTIPHIHEPMPLTQWICTIANLWESRLVASQDAEYCLSECKAHDTGILIGPEGGFSASEMDEILSCGFTPVNMGKTVMRSVTAAITAVGILGM
jgi:16S rRNA (uracil1498-N3)-methyltransferase